MIDPIELPFVTLDKSSELPVYRGVYFVISVSKIVYIGKASSLRRRWSNHHKADELREMVNVAIHWLDCRNMSRDEMHTAEQQFILDFKPCLNIVGGIHPVGHRRRYSEKARNERYRANSVVCDYLSAQKGL